MEQMIEYQIILADMVIKPNQENIVKNINSLECYDALAKLHNAHLLDVRTKAAWDYIGVPDLSQINKKTICVSWKVYPNMKINERFLDEIHEHNLSYDDHLFLICRSGQRSLHAANFLIQHGFNNCTNVEDGFEGIVNKYNQRSTINGWKFSKLPWHQT